MKTLKTKTLLVAALLVGMSNVFATADDLAAIASAGHTKAKNLARQYVMERDAAIARGVGQPHRAVISADADELYRLAHAGVGTAAADSLTPFIHAVTDDFKASIDAIDTPEKIGSKINALLAVANDGDDVLTAAAVAAINGAHAGLGGGNVVTNQTRGALKTALKALLDSINTVASLNIARNGAAIDFDATANLDAFPKSGSITELSRLRTHACEAVQQAVADFLESADAGNNPILEGAVPVGGGAGQVADANRDTVRDAIKDCFQ